MKRRDFLVSTSIAGLSAAACSNPLIALGANEPGKIAPPGAKIHRLSIFPSIGVCRVGNSALHFLAPEIPGVAPRPEGGFKDGGRRVKKQAQRFRIYAFDSEGRVIREVDSTTDEVTWSVKIANKKAGWYGFNNPLDMGAYAPGLAGKRRNDFWVGEDRKYLEIAPDPVRITGENTNSAGTRDEYEMSADFWKSPNEVRVKLGHVQTDERGRLIVMPGDGTSESAMRQNPIDNFADNDGWHDDWADGWVKASVTLEDGTTLPVEPAWVACCGPNYAPEIEPFITLYDTVRDVMVNAKKPSLEEYPKLPLSFKEEIYPFFRRLGLMEWTAAAANLRAGWVETGDFADPEYVRRLADPGAANAAFREGVLSKFRGPADYKFYDDADDFTEDLQYKIPYMLGSGVNYDFSPAHWFTMPKLQWWILTQWAEGRFTNDLDERSRADETLEFDDIPLDQQPMALTRAALEPLSGGAFHPGVELTWPLRQQGIFSDDRPYRLLVGDGEPMWRQVEKLGSLLTPQAVFGGEKPLEEHRSGESYSYYDLPADSPIGPQNPGDLTRWLGLPWHPDAFSCQMVLYSNDFPNAAWWPALLPIDVLPELAYDQLGREDLDDETKLKFFNDRVVWTRGVAGVGYHVEGAYMDGLRRMVVLWSHMGFVVKRPRPANLSAALTKLIPEELYVEVGRGSMSITTESEPFQGVSDD